jgi:hypothetical protein
MVLNLAGKQSHAFSDWQPFFLLSFSHLHKALMSATVAAAVSGASTIPCLVIPDLPSAVVGLVSWCIRRHHYKFSIKLISVQSFSLSAEGPGICHAQLEKQIACEEAHAIASLSTSFEIRSRSQGEMQTWRTSSDGGSSPCGKMRHGTGLDIKIFGFLHAALLRRGRRCFCLFVCV